MSSLYTRRTIWTGNTYPIRDSIRRLGGRWDKKRQAWIVPPLSGRQRADVAYTCRGHAGVHVAVDAQMEEAE